MNSQQWLKQVIRIRKRMIASGVSHKNALGIASDIAFLERHLTVNRYTGLTFASFFIRHSDKIYNILPGAGAGNHAQLVADFNTILEECNSLTNAKQTIQW